MIFDESLISRSCELAAQLARDSPGLASHDLKLALLKGMQPGSDLFHSAAQGLSIQKLCLLILSTFWEADRLRGDKSMPPRHVIDIMSHLQIFRDHAPRGAVIQCHGDAMLPLAAYFTSLGCRSFFNGSRDLCASFSDCLGQEISWLPSNSSICENAYHFCFAARPGKHLQTFFNRLTDSHYRGLVLLTSWSFLNSENSKILNLKERLVANGSLRVAIQLPPQLMPGMLLALLQFAPASHGTTSVRLINARDWSINSEKGEELSYLAPILDCVDGKNPPQGKHHLRPVPPAEDISRKELAFRHCDLRVMPAKQLPNSQRRLDDVCLLMRGQALPVSGSNHLAYTWHEAMLTDIDEFGLIRKAGRTIENAPALTPARRLALLKRNDILISCKGALQSLGRAGLILNPGPDWLPNQSFYIIRAETVDPIWLFYYLRSPTAQEWLSTHLSGTSVAQINVADLASLPIPAISEEQIAQAHKLLESLLKTIKKIEALKEKIDASESAMSAMFQNVNA